jgi:hypothetical protein
MKKRRKAHPRSGKSSRKSSAVIHDFSQRSLAAGEEDPPVKRPKSTARMSREERLRKELEAEEAERVKLKTIMIGICTFLEAKYV